MNESSSLRANLIARLALALFAVAALGTVAAYQLATLYGNQAYDRAQADDVITLANQVMLQEGTDQVVLPNSAVHWLLSDQQDQTVYRITDLRTGRVIASNGDLGATQFAAAESRHAGLRDTVIQGHHMRVAYQQRVITPKHIPVMIEIAETTDIRDQMTETILIATIAFMTITSLMALGLVWHGVGRALSPLKILEADAQTRSGTDLAPLDPLRAPQEVRGLIMAINQMMARVSSVMQSQNNFIANAAHQLRTPLSGLRLQAQLGLKSATLAGMRERLGEVETSAIRASDLVEKLLVLAKAESATSLADHHPVDLRKVAQDVIERLLILADSREVDLGLAGEAAPLLVQGNTFLFGELVGNLVHNSIVHGRTGGRVTIDLALHLDQAVIAVVDDGPGFADVPTDQLFSRFFRGDASNHAGNGLGLAIVHEITERYAGQLKLISQPGAGSRVEVRFPRLHRALAAD